MRLGLITDAIINIMNAEGETGEVHVMRDGAGSVRWAGDPSDKDIKITVTIESAPRVMPVTPRKTKE